MHWKMKTKKLNNISNGKLKKNETKSIWIKNKKWRY